VKVHKTLLILLPETKLATKQLPPYGRLRAAIFIEVIFMYSNLLENLRLVGLALVATIVIQIIFKAVLL
jgi:hypothetical protein